MILLKNISEINFNPDPDNKHEYQLEEVNSKFNRWKEGFMWLLINKYYQGNIKYSM